MLSKSSGAGGGGEEELSSRPYRKGAQGSKMGDKVNILIENNILYVSILSFRRVLYVVCFLLGISSASEV